MCEQAYEAEAVDCDNIERGASFDTCRGADTEGAQPVTVHWTPSSLEKITS
jgi:hypothetical protein